MRVLGELLALGTVPTTAEIVLGFLSFFFISAASLILNDFFYIENDRINAPDRPLPAGLVTEQDVVLLSLVGQYSDLSQDTLLAWRLC